MELQNLTTEAIKANLWAFWTWVIFIGGHWVVASLVVNTALRVRSAQKWVAWAEGKPALAWAIRWTRALGMDPAQALQNGASLLSAKAAVTAAGRAVSGFFGTESPPNTPPPADTQGGGEGRSS